MKLKVRLKGLDNREVLHYVSPVEVFLTDDNKTMSFIGYCNISRDENGDHFGTFDLNEEIDLDLYLYYRYLYNEARIDIFTAIELMKNEKKDSPTPKLRDRIMEQY